MALFSVQDGRETLWQWDTGRKLLVAEPACRQVHFGKAGAEDAYVCQVYEEDGAWMVDIPDVLLQTEEPVRVYCYIADASGGYTEVSESFEVLPRPKPQDYIYTQKEIWTVEKAVEEALQEAKANGDFKGDPGPKGDPGVVKFVVVTELPAENAENAIYLLLNQESAEGNLFDEYIFIDGKWEMIGSAAVAVDLEEYVKKTDYGSNTKVGLVRGNTAYGTFVNETNGVISIVNADKNHINNRVGYIPMTPMILDYAVKAGLTTNTQVLTEEEKTAACAWLGVPTVTANEDGTLSVVLSDGSKYKVYAEKEET